MGSFDWAETSELVGSYILQKMSVDIGSYQDDGLGVSSKPKRAIESLKRKYAKLFSEMRLKLTIDFLDVTMDLKTGLDRPYTKPNNTIQYVDTSSNHPPHIIENVPKGE